MNAHLTRLFLTFALALQAIPAPAMEGNDEGEKRSRLWALRHPQQALRERKERKQKNQAAVPAPVVVPEPVAPARAGDGEIEVRREATSIAVDVSPAEHSPGHNPSPRAPSPVVEAIAAPRPEGIEGQPEEAAIAQPAPDAEPQAPVVADAAPQAADAAPQAAAAEVGAAPRAEPAAPQVAAGNLLDKIIEKIKNNPLRAGAGIAGILAGGIGVGYLLYNLYQHVFGKGNVNRANPLAQQLEAATQGEQQLNEIAAAVENNDTPRARQLVDEHFPNRGNHRLRHDLRDGLSRRINELAVAEQRLANTPGNAQAQQAEANGRHLVQNYIRTQCIPHMRTERTRIAQRTQQMQEAAARQQRAALQQQQAALQNAQQQAGAGIGARQAHNLQPQEPGILEQMAHPINIVLALVAGTCLVQLIRGGWPFNNADPQPQPQPRPADAEAAPRAEAPAAGS